MEAWEFVFKKLSEKKSVVLIVVAESLGSSPGRQGFRMVVSSDGDLNGSVGGGIMEYNMVELARKTIKDGKSEPSIVRQVHNPNAMADRSGLICAGEQTHIFFVPGPEEFDTIRAIVNDIKDNKEGVITLTPKGLGYKSGESDIATGGEFHNSESSWRWQEKTIDEELLIIFGAGHVSIPLSQVAAMLGFRVIVFDDRPELSTMKANTFAHEKRVIDYKMAREFIMRPKKSYVVIMTFTHKTDELVLEQLLPLNVKYLGMIGSKSKVNTIFDNLRAREVSESDLKRVKSPIGLSIMSKTPAEIAISIAAELIGIRNS